MVDVVEGAFDIRINHPLPARSRVEEPVQSFERIMAAPSRSEPVAGGFEPGFPARLERILDHGLKGPVADRGNAKWPLFPVGLGDVDPFRGAGHPWVVVSQLVDELASGFRGLDEHAIHTSGSPAWVYLGDSAHTHESVGVAAQHELLERADRSQVARLCCPKDPLPQKANLPVSFAPVDATPIGRSHGSVCSWLHPTFPMVGVRCLGLWVTHQVHVSPLSGGYRPIQPVMISRCLSAAGLRFLDLPVPLEDSAVLTVGLLPRSLADRLHWGFHVPHL